ncbi:hypothetical protein CRG98_001460 [Punica granatum]|uniref:Uncharacterized protein n=1 Tax=Punica granatum TaxID=22663 RepID=A0A2I0LBR9_PUNGR|nr:hypothetical protein CRG98_001460 [Punica granatum]
MEGQANHQLEPWHELPDKVVMVSGASSGLGREFCLDLARAGCRIVAAARRPDRLKSLCLKINGAAVEPSSPWRRRRSLTSQLTGPPSRDSILSRMVSGERLSRFAMCDLGNVKSPLDLSEEEWDHSYNTNTKGACLVSKYVCIRMQDSNRGGSVINISSNAGLNRGHLPVSIACSSSKAALNTITKAVTTQFVSSLRLL